LSSPPTRDTGGLACVISYPPQNRRLGNIPDREKLGNNSLSQFQYIIRSSVNFMFAGVESINPDVNNLYKIFDIYQILLDGSVVQSYA